MITVVALTFATINFFGIRPAAAVSNLFTVGKLIPLFLFVAVGVFFIDPARFDFASPPTAGAFAASVLLLLFAISGSGFGSALVPAGEMRDPRRDVPFALLTAIGLVATLYFLVHLVSIGTLPDLARSDRPLADASALFLGRAGGALVASGALISSLGVSSTS